MSPISYRELVEGSGPPPPAERLPYASGRHRFGDLRLPPRGDGPFPVVVVVHGGCWLAEYDLDHVAPLSSALSELGWATWTLEYRRLGHPGGGWPGTFLDVAAGLDHLRRLAPTAPLDLRRVIAIGHSAGGHLALWLAGRGRLAAGPLQSPEEPLELRGALGLAAIADLAAYSRGTARCNRAVRELMGGLPEEVPERYRLASPREQLPLGVPLGLVHGDGDAIVPLSLASGYAAAARAAGDRVTLTVVEGAGHFEPIAPASKAWPEVVLAVRRLLDDGPQST